jgi:tRNA 2-thiocytidine biosynthesis protein TtcA
MTAIEKKISKHIGKAIHKYRMIEEGDKILVAVSGGKDSCALLYDLIKRQRSFPIKYTVEAINIKTDFCTCCKNSNLIKFFEDLGATYHIVPVPILARLQPGKEMNCYWCSSQRRKELMEFARDNGFTKVALGHHLDDIAETLLMNIAYKGEISGMLPVMKYDKFNGTVIRPLAMVQESWIITFAEQQKFDKLICNCPYGRKSKRIKVREAITQMAEDNHVVRENMLRSMHKVHTRYLLDDSHEKKG